MNELNAEFSVKKVKQPNGTEKDVEFVALSGGYLHKDVVVREVSDADRSALAEQYEAWKGPPAPDPKDAEIAALKAQIAAMPVVSTTAKPIPEPIQVPPAPPPEP